MEGQKDSSKWPIGLRFHDQKLYANGRLMVLSTLETEYLVEMHSVHYCAAAKIAPDVLRRTTISDVHAKLATVRKHCQLCQATTHPNNLPQGKLTPHPVPPRPFTSVATDIFAHTKSKDHRGDFKNKIVLVTCRHSGFLIGWSALEKGLTAETLA